MTEKASERLAVSGPRGRRMNGGTATKDDRARPKITGAQPSMRALVLAIIVAAACGRPSVSTGPSPAGGPLPPIPLVEGPLAIRVQYPAEGHLIESPDSNFIFGSIGNGKATLSINGLPARVYPNGAFMAFVPNPPVAAPRYELVARLGADSAHATREVRVAGRADSATAFVVDSATISPHANGLALRDSELVRVSVRLPAGASAWATLPGSAQPIALAPAASGGRDASLFATELSARELRGGGTLVAARGADTLRFPIARVAPPDSALPRYVRIGDPGTVPDTDRTIIGRPTPGGTYKWFFLPGTVAEATGHQDGFTRVRLDPDLEAWVADGDVKPVAAPALAPRRVTANARVRSAEGWVDLVIPIGERPAYFVEESESALSLVLYGTRANTDIINYAANDTLVRTVEWSQERDGRARYTMRLRQPLYGYLVFWENGALVLRVRRPPRVNARRPLLGRTIAVDPGHPPIGATGPTGLYEGQAVLWVGERLKRLLEERGARVVMTRTTMEPVALGDRPIIARRANADAFVSIHLNAYGDGVNVFAARNGSGTYFFRALSEPLARPIQRSLVAQLGLPDLGVYYDNLAVVRQTWMPSVLCEGAFVIMPEQEAALRTPEYQERYARGIADGLEEYFRGLAK